MDKNQVETLISNASAAAEYLNASTTGFQDAKSYDTHRPSYPAAAVQTLLAHLSLSDRSHAKIIDVAAGTGKFTELLSQRGENYEILAVEPTASMRETLRAKGLRGVSVRDGVAAGMGVVEDGWADGVVAAQSFHWFANEDALREIWRVLKPGGGLAMIWNVEDYNQPADWTATSKWEQILKQRIIKLDGFGPPRFRHSAWPDVFSSPAQQQQQLFSTPLRTEKLPWTVWLSVDMLWKRIYTLSHVCTLGVEEEVAFRRLFEDAVREGNGEFNERGEVAVHGVTYLAWTMKLS